MQVKQGGKGLSEENNETMHMRAKRWKTVMTVCQTVGGKAC